MPILLSRLLRLGPRRHALVLVSGAIVCIVVGGALFAATQHLPLTTGWYWAITTATTVGYGDVTPKNPIGRLVASAVMLTTIPLLAATFAVVTGSAVASGVRRLLELGSHFPEGSYRLVLGMHPAVPVVLAELEHADDAVVLVADVEPSSVPGHVHLIRGDPSDEATLARAHPEGAAHILVAPEDDGDVVITAILVRQEAPEVPITALVSARRLIPALKDLGVGQVLSPDDLVGHTVAKALEAPHAGEVLMHLVRGDEHRLVEHVVDAQAEPRALSAIRIERGDLVLGVVQGTSLSLGVKDDPVVRPGDILLLVEPNGYHDHLHRGHGPANPQEDTDTTSRGASTRS